MNDDGGIQWFQTVAEEQEEQEYLEWLDEMNTGKAMAQPVNAPAKEIENVEFDCE